MRRVKFRSILGLLAVQVLVVGHLAVDELAVGGKVKDAVANGLNELMVVGGHQYVALHRLQTLVQSGDGLDPDGWWAGPASARWRRRASS